MVAAQIGTGAATFMKGDGCTLCHGSGYQGRVGVYELLRVTDKMRELIVAKSTHSQMRKLAVEEGMQTMQVAAFQMVADGVTTVDEVLRSVYAPGVDLETTAAGELMPGKKEIESGPLGIPEGESLEGPSDDDSSPPQFQIVEGGG
jgi:type IV pilus assembly protein PilB